MAIELITYSGSNVLPEYDASLHDALGGLNGIISGCEVTSVNNGLHIAAGDGILAGRYFKIDEEQIAVTLPASGSVASALYIHMDLTDADTPIDIIAGPVPSYAYDRASGVFDLRLATYDAVPSGITNLTPTAPLAENNMVVRRATAYSVGDIVIATTCRDGVFECTEAGTTAEIEPSYNTFEMGEITDGTAVFVKRGYVNRRSYYDSSDSYTQSSTSNVDKEINNFGTTRGLFLATVSVKMELSDVQQHPGVLQLVVDNTVVARQSFPADHGAYEVYTELVCVVNATGGTSLKLRIPGIRGSYSWIYTLTRFA